MSNHQRTYTPNASKAQKQPRGFGPRQGEGRSGTKTRTPGFLLERVGRYKADGTTREAVELHDEIKHHAWYPQARFLGFGGKWALFERPDPDALKNTLAKPAPLDALEKYREVG